ncbi:hydroxysqualene dehydroxylase [Nannocystis bainbridge]|uniref:FAD-dependent oxidoreductase n=1 Tax=Nannocystis bainbridge TaxID=2995303 RepID=A0ABT5DRM5_9BACT|nr:FAD-dependent oxidoreductase [Nannocystis bainbridge]MDC0716309.1 FAD-dependent oxidoreductase [Nannocystis bainbridge]
MQTSRAVDVPALETDVVILGGGIAGLTCAVGLLGSGLRLVVLERDRLLGGRARSWADPTTGDPVHVGPHIVTNYYPNFFRLLERLGTADRVVWGPEEVLYTMFDGERAVELRRSSLPPPVQMLATLCDDPALGLLDLASNATSVQVALGLDEREVLRLDDLDGAAALAAMGVRPAMLRRYWQFAAMSILNTPVERCSAGSLMRTFHHAISRDAVRIGFPGCGLGDLFAPGARAAIEAAGHAVWTGTAVTELLGDDGRATGVRLADGRQLRARHVVSSLPPADLAALVPDRWRHLPGLDALPWFQPVTYVSVYLWFDRRITRRQFWARSYAPDDLNCDFYDYANIYPDWGDRPSLIGSNIIDAARIAGMSDDEIVAGTRRELDENLPQARTAELRHAAVHRIPLAVQAPLPGFEARRPTADTAVAGLVLAGDWTRTGLPSSMEGAAASGWRAAELVRTREDRPRALVRPLPPRGVLARALMPVSRLRPWPSRLRRALSRG